MEINPEYEREKFQCPHCNAIAQQVWFNSSDLCST